MNRIKLSDEEWTRILASLKKLPGVHIGLADICRQFVNAILWILRTGAQWRVLPSTYGKLKHYRRIATRYEKKAINYMGMLSFSSELL
jgi:transposase